MAFTGIVPASSLEVAPCGLFSVAEVVDHREEDEHWIGGATVETNAFPAVQLRTNQDTVITGGAGVIYDNSASPKNYKTTPFFIEIKSTESSFNYLRKGEDLTPEMVEQIRAVAQKAVERELWEGAATQGATPASDAGFLRRNTSSVKTSGGVTPEKALALIEQSISDSPTGGRGVIHMTRDVASQLGSRLKWVEKNEIDEKTFALTRLGTSVVIGSGYTGAGPIGAGGAAASPTNKWIYATGGVTVELGKEFVQTYGVQATNDFYALISLPASVHFDPSIFSAAQVTLP